MLNNIHTLTRKQRFLNIRDTWYDINTIYTDADVVYYMQMGKPVGDDYYEHFTIISDLTETPKQIFGRINATGKNLINYIANKPGYKHTILFDKLDVATILKFQADYNNFAHLKNLSVTDIARLKTYHKQGLLAISFITNGNNEIVTWHVYRVNQNRVMLLESLSTWFKHTTSKMKTEMSAANRYCHYKDMLYFKEIGVQQYDWGGWYTGSTNKALLGVNSFKAKFGGTVLPNYNSIVYISLKGKLFRFIKKLMNKK